MPRAPPAQMFPSRSSNRASMPPSPRRSFSSNSDVPAELIRKSPRAVPTHTLASRSCNKVRTWTLPRSGSATSTNRVPFQRNTPPSVPTHTSFAPTGRRQLIFVYGRPLAAATACPWANAKTPEFSVPNQTPPSGVVPREMMGGDPGKRSGFASCSILPFWNMRVPPTRSDSNTCPF